MKFMLFHVTFLKFHAILCNPIGVLSTKTIYTISSLVRGLEAIENENPSVDMRLANITYVYIVSLLLFYYCLLQDQIWI